MSSNPTTYVWVHKYPLTKRHSRECFIPKMKKNYAHHLVPLTPEIRNQHKPCLLCGGE